MQWPACGAAKRKVDSGSPWTACQNVFLMTVFSPVSIDSLQKVIGDTYDAVQKMVSFQKIHILALITRQVHALWPVL